MSKKTVKDIQSSKGRKKLTKVTALDYYSARLIEKAEIDIIGLDGPPIEIYYKGARDGLKADLEELIFSLEAVRRGAPESFIMAPIPYKKTVDSYESTLDAADRLIKAGADAVKVEGGGDSFIKIKGIVSRGIPCVGTTGHNQEIYVKEGFRCIGKKADEAIDSYRDAIELQNLGVAWIEIECMPYKVAIEISDRIKIPTIGIGSGPGCDGQFLHSEDILGMHDNYYPKHCRRYLNFYEGAEAALQEFKSDVEENRFPDIGNSFEMEESEYLKFREGITRI
jgi:3-methyl-2-oxobutanoate hydroxymethyltransferase